jgi:L-alanine-DL-glutamate epimerase-like enolase superfamily enzyme
MIITGLRFGRLRVPLKTPFKTTTRTVDAIDDLVVMIDTDDGRVGYGSATATPLITGDTHGGMLDAIRHHLVPVLLGEDATNLTVLTTRVQAALARNTSAKAAVDIALHDLFGQRYAAPMYRLLGGGEPAITTDLTISVDYIEKMVADAIAAVESGFEALKIKVGKDPGVDVERVKAVHAAIDGRALLRLDVNQGWTAKQAVRALHELEDAGVRLDQVEQPVRAWDLAGMAYVTERVDTPIVADESVTDVVGVAEIIRRRAADIINIKLMKTGGITNAVRIADLAATHEIECMIGCMLEGAISVAAAAHLAVARSDVITRVDLDGPSLGRFNPVEGNVRFADAEITIGEGPGLGITAVHGLEPVES